MSVVLYEKSVNTTNGRDIAGDVKRYRYKPNQMSDHLENCRKIPRSKKRGLQKKGFTYSNAPSVMISDSGNLMSELKPREFSGKAGMLLEH